MAGITYYCFEKNRTGSQGDKLKQEYLAGNYDVAYSQRGPNVKHGPGVVDIRTWFRDWVLEMVDYTCQMPGCGWRHFHPVSEKPLVEIHHDDGDKFNNAPENIHVLCPNCHSLTYNFKTHGRTEQ